MLIVAAGCENSNQTPSARARTQPAVNETNNPLAGLPEPTDMVALRGREIWLETCKPCHATGLAGAPIIGRFDKWSARIAQGMDVLFEHALHGFEGNSGNQMPARGGNVNLTDDDVKAAVIFMVQTTQAAHENTQ